jgi:uncharacterized protein YunC (DUF1805 family)
MIYKSFIRGKRALPVTQPASALIADSITRVGAEAVGAVVVNGSHGGIYAAYIAAKLRVAAAVFNDAGVGRDEAGIAGLDYLAELGIPAAVVGHDTARIGDGSDMMARGFITHANSTATALGCSPGMTCRDAVVALQQARPSLREPPPALEAAFLLIAETPVVWALDSASLVGPEQVGTIVVTGSHGGLLGGRPDTALKADALAALFNDAGIGTNEAGVTRLPALDDRGIAAGTVATSSARIGDARSTYEDGILTRVNRRAAAHGIAPGMTAREFVEIVRRAAAKTGRSA